MRPDMFFVVMRCGIFIAFFIILLVIMGIIVETRSEVMSILDAAGSFHLLITSFWTLNKTLYLHICTYIN